jgi:hypothetical protein
MKLLLLKIWAFLVEVAENAGGHCKSMGVLTMPVPLSSIANPSSLPFFL